DGAGRLAVNGPQAGRMAQEPERRKVGVELFGKDEIEIGLDIGGPCETWVVAKESQLRAIGDDAPERLVARVQEFLHQAVRRAPSAFIAKARVGAVKVVIARRQEDGNGSVEGLVGDRVGAARSEEHT